MKPPTTSEVVVDPKVIAKMLVLQAQHPRNETGALLLGRVDGALYVQDIVPAVNLGTAVSVEFTPADFERAAKKVRGRACIIGWAHGHPSYGAFLSHVDIRHQTEGQMLFPNYVALVLDPFRRDGIQFRFFRVLNGKTTEVPHRYGKYTCNTRGKSSSRAGIRKRLVAFTRVSSAAAPSARKSRVRSPGSA